MMIPSIKKAIWNFARLFAEGHYRSWSDSTHRLRKLITAVEGHYLITLTSYKRL
jgi:hypothetical protein